jgi:hypothetical protein
MGTGSVILPPREVAGLATKEVPEAELLRAQRLGWRARHEGADYLHVRPLGDGRAVYLLPAYAGNLRLAIGEMGAPAFDDVWCFQAPQTDEAWRAALGWDGQGEPEGWYRHPHTGRRRPGGDPQRQTVYW